MTRFFIIIATILSMTTVTSAATDQSETNRHNQQTPTEIDSQEVRRALLDRVILSRAFIADIKAEIQTTPSASERAKLRRLINVERTRIRQFWFLARRVNSFSDRRLQRVVAKYNLPVSYS